MKESGPTGVTQFRAKFRLWAAGSTPGIDRPLRMRTYESPVFSNDGAVSNERWLPYRRLHRWKGLLTGEEFRLDAKLTWVRPLRQDVNFTIPLGSCIVPGE